MNPPDTIGVPFTGGYGEYVRADIHEELREVVGVFVSVHGTRGLPARMRETALSCAFRATTPSVTDQTKGATNG